MCVCCCFLVSPHYIKSLWNEFITNEQRTHDVSRQIEILFVKSPRNHFSTKNMKWSPEDSQEAYTHCCHFGWGGVHQYVHQYAFPIAFRSFIHFWFISCIVMIHTFLLKSLSLIGSLLRIPRRILFSSSGLLRIPRRPAGLMKRSAPASSSGQLVVNSQQWNPNWDRVQSRKYETRK